MFYKINRYNGEIKKDIELNEANNDSLGAEFYPLSNLKEEELSPIALMEINKLGYKLRLKK